MNDELKKIVKTHNIAKIRQCIKIQLENNTITSEVLLSDFLDYGLVSLNPLKALYTEGYEENCFVKDVAKWVIENNQIALIPNLLINEMCPLMELVKTSLEAQNVKILNFLLNDDNFYLSPEKKLLIHIQAYLSKDNELIEQCEMALFKGDYEINDTIISHNGKISLLMNILLSTRIEHIAKINEKFNIDLMSFSHILQTAYKDSLYKGFLDNSGLEQERVLSFLMTLPSKPLVPDFIFTTYAASILGNNVEDKHNKFSYVLYQLIEKGLTSIEEFKEKTRIPPEKKEEFLKYYQVYCEKEILSQTLNEEKNASKIKLKL